MIVLQLPQNNDFVDIDDNLATECLTWCNNDFG